MWLRICLLVTIATTLVNATGVLRLVHPALIPGWFERFPNSRILLNRDYFNYLYRRLILRDPYWYRRLNIHRHRHLHIHPGYYRRNVRVLAPQIQPAVHHHHHDHPHLIGQAETFVRYSSPTISRYNTPWEKISSRYQDYGEVHSPSIYDRHVHTGGVYDEHAHIGAAGLYDQEVYHAADVPVGGLGVGVDSSVQSAAVLPSPYPEVQNPHQHLVGQAETYVRYSSPDVSRYNTPWSRVASSYQDYGEVGGNVNYAGSGGVGGNLYAGALGGGFSEGLGAGFSVGGGGGGGFSAGFGTYGVQGIPQRYI